MKKSNDNNKRNANLKNVLALRKENESQLKEKSTSLKESIYFPQFNDKKIRSKIRRTLDKICNQILGKDRNEKEIEEGIKEFLSFYKEHYKLNNFKIESLSNTSNEEKKKDYILVLEIVKAYLGN